MTFAEGPMTDVPDDPEGPRGAAPVSSSGQKAGRALAAEDLSAEIVDAVDRRPGDVVRCTKVVGNRYRCNWWSAQGTGGYDNPGMGGLLVTTHRVSRSEFLRVTKGEDGTLILRVLGD